MTKPFVKGDARINRKGRPKVGQSISEKVRDALAERLNGNYSMLDSIIDAQIQKALKGDLGAAEWLTNRGFGKMIEVIDLGVRQKHDLSKLSDEEYEQLKQLETKTMVTDDSDSSGQ